MRIVVDDVGLADQSDARVLEHRLGELTELGHQVIVLDRGRDLDFGSCQTYPFPSYERDRVNAADSEMLQRYCDNLAADIFLTTGSTTPMTTPAIMLAGRETSSATLREHDELRLCRKYCHAIIDVFDPKSADRFDQPRRHGKKQVETFEEALSRRVYPKVFYDEWARLRRLQNKLDTRIWSDYVRLGT